MTADATQLKQYLTELDNAIKRLEQYIQQAVEAADAEDSIGVLGIVGIAGMLLERDYGARIYNLGRELVEKLLDFQADLVVLPILIEQAGNVWQKIQVTSQNMSGYIAGQLQAYQQEWTGIAGGKYSDGVSRQAGYASTIASLASKVSQACLAVASSAVNFIIILVNQVINVVTSVLSLDPGQVISAIEDALVACSNAVTNLEVSLGNGPVRQLSTVIGAGGFPNGNWPTAATPQ